MSHPSSMLATPDSGSFKDSYNRSEPPFLSLPQSALSLPPPPTLSRKIVHVSLSHTGSKPANNAKPQSTGKSTNPRSKGKRETEIRRAARRSAHTEIERRRRAKMNEVLDKLKSLTPACHIPETGGVDPSLQKLVVLQACADYIEHLHMCIERLSQTPPKRIPVSSLLS